jgi:hypothetical protein
MKKTTLTTAAFAAALLGGTALARAEVVTVQWSAVVQAPEVTPDDIVVQGTTTYDTDAQRNPSETDPEHGDYPGISTTITLNGGSPSSSESFFITQYNNPSPTGDILQYFAFVNDGQLLTGTDYRVFLWQIDYRDSSGGAWPTLGLPSTQAQLDALDDFKFVLIGLRNSAGHTVNAFSLTPDDLVLVTDTVSAACNGFFEPFADPIGLSKKERRVIPLRMTLADDGGVPLTSADVTAPTVSVKRTAGTTIEDLDTLVTSPGAATSGNSFVWNEVAQQWEYNLSTSPYTAAGTYNVSMVAGDDAYALEQPCTGTFVRR